MHGSSQRLIAGKFHVVKIDVGNFDNNLDLAQRHSNPIGKGIPAVVVLRRRKGSRLPKCISATSDNPHEAGSWQIRRSVPGGG